MGILSSIYYFFRPYTDAHERRVARFFDGLSEHHSRIRTSADLDKLIQENLAVINLWTEYRYKGYRYLSKSKRRELYTNLDRIVEEFERFYRAYQPSAEAIIAHVRTVVPGAQIHTNQTKLLQAIMDYLSPSHGRYEYRASSSFGRLLRDPAREVMVGDCNQIVTLYIYLYSRYFDVADLRVRTLPGHVALHYGGVDIEATNGTWANYASSPDTVLMPIGEIVSINLLDTTDSYLETHEVSAEDFLQSARFAYLLSHERDIVTRNLDAAYARLINTFMARDNYDAALKFARQSRDVTLLSVVGHNGAVYAIQHDDFKCARKFAEYAVKRAELVRDSYRAEGVYHYDAHRYHDAIKSFERYGDKDLVRKCYEALFFAEQNNLPQNLTGETIKQHTRTIKRMRDYAKRSGNRELEKHADSLRKYL